RPDGHEPVAHVARCRPGEEPLAADELRRYVDPAGVTVNIDQNGPRVLAIVTPFDPAGDLPAALQSRLIQHDRESATRLRWLDSVEPQRARDVGYDKRHGPTNGATRLRRRPVREP